MTSLANFNSAGNWWMFNADKTYTYVIMFNKDGAITKGKYTFDDKKLYLTGSAEKNYFSVKDSYKGISDKTYRYYFENVDGKILSGKGANGKFMPRATTTREQAIVMGVSISTHERKIFNSHCGLRLHLRALIPTMK